MSFLKQFRTKSILCKTRKNYKIYREFSRWGKGVRTKIYKLILYKVCMSVILIYHLLNEYMGSDCNLSTIVNGINKGE